MELIRGIHNIRQQHRQCVLTIGNFDGVHLGHEAILNRVKELASEYQTASCIMIFEPQPREFFLSKNAPGRISRFRDKLKMLQSHDIDYVLCLPFNEQFQQLSAELFCQSILQGGLNIQHLVVGDDFRFGCDRQGSFDYLYQFGKQNRFVVENTPSVMSASKERISSSLVRRCLSIGDVKTTEQLLGHPMSLSGRVVHGQELGRTLGFPTANVHLKAVVPALSGVFAVEFAAKHEIYKGVANIGFRPTVNGKTPILEVHLFEFDGSLYDDYVDVRFCHFIRKERKMSGLLELEKQIQSDKEEAQSFFKDQ